MRTTITLEADVEALVKRTMRERGVSFKRAVNDAIRAGMAAPRPVDASFATYAMGEPLIDVTQALRLAGELEDQELSAKLARGS
ncbi:MAG: antitoxin [Actinomycetota bacterium]|nr:antitoxin [Actinomycetota bacterium]